MKHVSMKNVVLASYLSLTSLLSRLLSILLVSVKRVNDSETTRPCHIIRKQEKLDLPRILVRVIVTHKGGDCIFRN